MANRIRITEAINYAKSQGKKIKKMDFAGKIFTYTTARSAVVCLNNYERGQSTKMDKQQIHTICRETGVDPNFLFGWKIPMIITNTNEDGKEESTESPGPVHG